MGGGARLRASRYVVVNAEEGEPGVFKDRYLSENDPHALVEGLLIAAHAVESDAVFVYLNGEADFAGRRLATALAQAEAAALLGGVRVELRRGAGGYVCGEESVILSSIEGERAALCGGPSGGLMPATIFETPLLGGVLDAGGAALGAGGIVAIDDFMLIGDVVYQLAAYNAAESCGKCTPCREGAPRMRDLLDGLRQGTAPDDAIELLDALDEAIANASLCGLGQMAPLPYRSARTHFLGELTG